MIRQLLVIDQAGAMTRHIEKIFGGFLKGYQVLHAAGAEEALGVARTEMIDVIVINGDDLGKSLAYDIPTFLKKNIFPPAKLLLLLEPNLINTLPALEGAVHAVVDSSNFRSHQFRRIVDKLIHVKYMEEKEKREKELEEKKDRSRRVWAKIDMICDDLEKKSNSE